MTSKPVALQIGNTRSLGTPASAHLETPCGETDGVKIAPIAAYEPSARQTRWNGAAGSFMEPSINRELKEINPRLLHVERGDGHHQPMVEKRETMADRLLAMKGDMSLEEFGALAGKSATAAMKWLRGGNVKDATLRELVSKEPYRSSGITVEWIRYGDQAVPSAAGLSMMAVDIATRWMALSSDRQDWFRDLIFTMHFMEARFPAMRKGRPSGEHYSGRARHAADETHLGVTKLEWILVLIIAVEGNVIVTSTIGGHKSLQACQATITNAMHDAENRFGVSPMVAREMFRRSLCIERGK